MSLTENQGPATRPPFPWPALVQPEPRVRPSGQAPAAHDPEVQLWPVWPSATTMPRLRPEPPPLPRSISEMYPPEQRVRRIGWLSAALLTGDVLVAGVVTAPLMAATDMALWLLAPVSAVLVASRAACRLHRTRLRLSWMDDLPRSFVALAVAFGLVAAGHVLLAGSSAELVVIGGSFMISWGVAELVRAVLLRCAHWKRVRWNGGDRTLVVGAGEVGRDLMQKMLAHPEFGLRPVAVVDPTPMFTADELGVPVLTVDLAEAIRAQQVVTVVLAFSAQPESTTVDAAITAHRLGCRVLVVPRMFELYLDAPDVERLRNYPLVRLPEDPTRRPTWWIKRVLDVVVAALTLVLVSPVLLGCAIAILVESGRPVFFVQRRVGLGGRTFHLCKLRSMLPADEAESQALWSIANDARVGRVGRFLRRTSLDELPQLWNILRGEMSVVGPRPERPGFVHHFSEQHQRYWARHRVPAGLTGLAQVNGLRGDTSIADRARYDNYYIASWSLWLDARVVLLTVRELLRRGEH